ncbi:MAG: PEP-CTERM sorting domain-containing protein [Planctomycetia bacterium]|nr:PEP-CTERM sorting domain-containing protein [Planctomycetia bacterium]
MTTDSGTSTGTDARFGSGTIYLNGGTIQSARSGSRAYVLNNIVVNADSTLKATTHELSLNGAISGTGDLTLNGASYTLYLRGDNSHYQGDWHINVDYVCIDNDGTKTPSVAGDYTFGQGTVYLQNGAGIRTSGQGVAGYVGADIVVESGKTGNLRYGIFTMGGTVTVDGTLGGNNSSAAVTATYPSMKVAGTLQGTGLVNLPVSFVDDGLVSAGTVGSVGTLTFGKTADLSNARIQADIGLNGADSLIFSGETTLANTTLLDVNLLSDVSLVGGVSYDILKFDGGLVLPPDFDWNAILSPETAYLFNASFAGNTLNLTVDGAAVPEPGSCVLLLLGLAGGFLALRKKRTVAVAMLLAVGWSSAAMAQGVSLTVGSDGVTQNLTLGTPVVCDSLTGTGRLTLTTPDGTRNTVSTYGTFQLGTGATVSGFTGNLYFDRAILDLNGNSLTAGTITVPTSTTTSGTTTTTTYQDTVSTIKNSSANTATLKLTGGGYLYTPLEGAIRLEWSSTGSRNLRSANTHTGGSQFSQGTLVIVDTQALGSGKVEFSGLNVNFQASGGAFRLTQEVALSGTGTFRMQNGSTLELAGEVSGSGTWMIPFDGGWVRFSGAQKSYTGKIQVGTATNAWTNASARATLQLSAENVLNPQSELGMENAYGGSYVELNGYNQQIRAISGQGTIQNSSYATRPATISVEAASGTLTLQNGVTIKVTEKGNHALGTGEGAGTVDFAGGTLTVTQMDTATLILQDDTVLEAVHGWGKTVLAGSNNTTSSFAPSAYQANMDAEVNTNRSQDNSVFPTNTTMSFTTYVDVAEEMQLSFLKNFDDYGHVWIRPVLEDGTLGTRTTVVESDGGTEVGTNLNTSSSGNWNAYMVGETTLAAGRYFLEVRVGQGSGGVGPTGGQTLGIGIKAGGNVANSDQIGQYRALTVTDNLIAGIAGLEVISPELSVASDISIAAGKSLTLRPGNKGHIHSTGTISGAGSHLILEGASGAVTLTGKNTYDGGTTVGVKELTLGNSMAWGSGDVTFTEATTVNLNERVDANFYKAWAEGSISNTSGLGTALPTSTVQKAEPTYMQGSVSSSNTTYVYTSSPLTALDDFTLWLGEDFDDYASYKITDLTTGDSQYGENLSWSDATTNWNYAFQKGHDYQLEIRLCNAAYGGGAGGDLGTGIGFGARLSESDPWQLLTFDENGILMNTPLEVMREVFVLNNNLNLEEDVTFNAASASKEVTLGGKISGDAGGLKLQNGHFRLTNAENSAKSLSLENVTYQLGRETGIFEATDSLEIKDSTLVLDLTRLDAEPLPEDFAWLSTTGEVVLENVTLVLDYEGDVASKLTTLTLLDGEDGTDWAGLIDAISISFLNSQLRGGLAIGAGGDLQLYFGNAASVPEPGTWGMLLFGLGSLILRRRWKSPKILG